MRTNIVLNDELVAEAFQYSDASIKRGLVEEALQDLSGIVHEKDA